MTRCSKCCVTRADNLFIGKQGKIRKTCQQCRDRAAVLAASEYAARSGRIPEPAARVTMLDYPRVYHPERREPSRRQEYMELHKEFIKRRWMVGANKRVNWCLVHEHNAWLDCDDCLREALEWTAGRALARDLARLAEAGTP